MDNIVYLPREKVLRDPVHNYIQVKHKVILDLINSREFQRLRRVKQLGTSSFTFHGAEHTRFTHSLGVYEITRQICNGFSRNYPTKTPEDGLWDDNERLVALCAALLHDIGHGPYSHAFEHIFSTNHEEWTQRIITEPTTEVNKILRQVADDFPNRVASVIKKTYHNPQVVQMISSQIDADRMDYLVRDAYNTGTNYGMFDLTRVLRVMRPYKDGIAFESDGMHAVEDYILARFQMYQQIYFHPASRGMEVVLTHLLRRAKNLYEEGKMENLEMPNLLIPFFEKKLNVENYLRLDDGVLNTYFNIWRDHPDEILKDLANRFLDRRPFKSITFNDSTKHLIPLMQDLVEKSGYDINYYTAINNSSDLPYDAFNEPKSPIEIIQDDGTLNELSTLSRLVASISDKIEKDERFYFPKKMLAANDNSIFSEYYTEFQRHIKNQNLI